MPTNLLDVNPRERERERERERQTDRQTEAGNRYTKVIPKNIINKHSNIINKPTAGMTEGKVGNVESTSQDGEKSKLAAPLMTQIVVKPPCSYVNTDMVRSDAAKGLTIHCLGTSCSPTVLECYNS